MILPCSKKSIDVVEEYAKNDPIVIPTDTLYGLSMSIYGDLKKIYLLKKRDLSKKIPVGVADLDTIKKIAVVEEREEKIITEFMPGALTVILKSKIPKITGETIGVRIPDHKIPRELARRIGPITLTSANISGEKNPVKIEDTMNIKVQYRIDCGVLSGTQSTIIDLSNGIKLIRSGVIPFSAVLKIMRR